MYDNLYYNICCHFFIDFLKMIRYSKLYFKMTTIPFEEYSKDDLSHKSINNNYDKEKQDIIELFYNNVKGVEISYCEQNNKHCGKEGYWLEKKMGIRHNSSNEPDINGYEMKTSTNVITFIDKSPDNFYINNIKINKKDKILKTLFWKKYSSIKKTDIPTIGGWKLGFNNDGQKLVIDDSNNVCIKYNYNHDMRKYKDTLDLDKNEHIIMQWDALSLKKSIDNKFNIKGFFTCVKKNECFEKICFGKKITFEIWIEELKKGIIYHDGYSKLNGRGRQVFRANKSYWNSLIIEVY